VFQLARAALREMIAQGGGSIVNIASERAQWRARADGLLRQQRRGDTDDQMHGARS